MQSILIIGVLNLGILISIYLGQIMPEVVLIKYGPWGFSFILLIYFLKLIQDHRKDIKQMFNVQSQMFKDQRDTLINIIAQNTKAMEDLREEIRCHNQH